MTIYAIALISIADRDETALTRGVHGDLQPV